MINKFLVKLMIMGGGCRRGRRSPCGGSSRGARGARGAELPRFTICPRRLVGAVFRLCILQSRLCFFYFFLFFLSTLILFLFSCKTVDSLGSRGGGVGSMRRWRPCRISYPTPTRCGFCNAPIVPHRIRKENCVNCVWEWSFVLYGIKY